jgi:two-component sensor histidine kinase
MNPPTEAHLKVLMIEDYEDDALLVVHALRSGGYELFVRRVQCEQEMREALLQSKWDLILSDFRLPEFTALKAFAIYREFGLDIPFLIVSGVIGEETAVAAMKAGVHDYVNKDNLARLVPAVRRELREAESRRERARAEEALHAAYAQLAESNRSLDRKLEEIQIALAEKEVLFKEVQHRVKNNLQVISSLLSLQAEKAGSEQARAVLADSRDRVRSMALIHEQLCYSGHMAEIEFSQYIDRLARGLLDGYIAHSDRIQVRTEVDVVLSLDQAMPCGLIVQELLSNSLKHAFPGEARGEIRIQFHQFGREFQLHYGDNGIGFPPEFDVNRSRSLGMQLISDLSAQLHGRLSCFNAGGAQFRLTFSAREK